MDSKKDVIIGGASGYNWDQLKYWVNSIVQTGFDGRIVLIATDISIDTLKMLEENGVNVSCYGEKQPDGSWKRINTSAPHVERFFYIWSWLAQQDASQMNRVIATDVRDVVFQKNPSHYDHLKTNKLLLSSEGLRYDNEPWGKLNFQQTFGPFFYKMIADKTIYNVGVQAGPYRLITDMFLMIFQMSINRSISIVDQAVYNFLINIYSFERDTMPLSNRDGWAIQLGTTIEAVKVGSGDLGMICRNDPSKLIEYESNYEDEQPVLNGDVVTTQSGVPFVVVHQYDRIPHLRKQIEDKYNR